MRSLVAEDFLPETATTSGRNYISSEEFRRAMSAIPSAVAILTTNGPAGRWGITISAMTSVSDDPPTLLSCVNRCSRANGIIKANGVVALNLLTKDQDSIADLFAGKVPVPMNERFDRALWCISDYTAPRLSGALVVLEGDVLQSIEVATHTVFMIGVKNASLDGPSHPAIYYQRAYRTLTGGG
jgi:flavin reductase (DIM6/NTAB) family NADH-FMN oxidoreductase RutF